jgi:hypothetical protein
MVRHYFLLLGSLFANNYAAIPRRLVWAYVNQNIIDPLPWLDLPTEWGAEAVGLHLDLALRVRVHELY